MLVASFGGQHGKEHPSQSLQFWVKTPQRPQLNFRAVEKLERP